MPPFTVAPKSAPGPAPATGFLRFDGDGHCVECNATLPPGLPRPPADWTSIREQQCLTGILAHAVRITGKDGACSAKAALHICQTTPENLTMELPGGAHVALSGFANPEGGRCYVLMPLDASARRTEVRRTEGSETRQAQELLHSAIQSMNEGVGLWDREFRLVTCNQAYADYTGVSVAQYQPGVGYDDMARIVARSGGFAEAEGHEAAFVQRIIDMRRNFQKNVELEMKDGRWINCSCHRTDLGGVLFTLFDATEHHQIDQAQQEADLLVRTIVEASPTPFLVSRVEDGKILYCPPASRERFGKLETTLGFFLDPQDRVDYLNALLPTGHLDNYPVRFRRQDGSIMQGLTSARVMDFKGENVIVSSTRDMTEYLAMQAELEKQQELAHQNEKLSALGALLAGVAHELNNPLSIVVGYALMLQDKVSDPVLKRRVERIGQSAERCTRIVRTFLAMARQRPMEIEHCQINELIEAALEVAGYGLKSAGAEVRLELDGDLPLVEADPDQIVQVFTNLIVNAEHAVSALGEKACVCVRARADPLENRVIVEISDNGPGIAPDIQARIFEPFFTTKDVGAGTGVGLAFCHRIIATHGGELTVSSPPGEGACFRVSLKPASAPAEHHQTPRPPAAPTGTLHVLSIDDEEGVTELIADILEDAGYTVTTCNDPRRALALVQHQNFDAILSDMRMPGLDGKELLHEITRHSPHHLGRIGFVTGDAMSKAATDFLRDSDCPFMEKPISPNDLLKLVENLTRARATKG